MRWHCNSTRRCATHSPRYEAQGMMEQASMMVGSLAIRSTFGDCEIHVSVVVAVVMVVVVVVMMIEVVKCTMEGPSILLSG